jgi:hypothetical protein
MKSATSPPAFDRLLTAITPHLGSAAISSLSKSRVRALAKLTGQQEPELAALIAAHKLAVRTGMPPSTAFAVRPNGVAPNADFFASQKPSNVRKKLESAVKKNIVPAASLTSFDAAKPKLARLQAHETPIKALVKTYGLSVPDALIRKLAAKKIETLADLRSAGGSAVLAKTLNVKPNDRQLENVVAHAHLSLLGTDVATNAAVIKQGYSRISAIADTPEGVFVARVGPAVGVATAQRMKRIATAQQALLQNGVADLLAKQANGFDLGDVPPLILIPTIDTRCSCEDCNSAVSPLAYLADLIGYATTKIGRRRHVVLYDQLSPHDLGDLFYQPFNDLPTSCDLMNEQVRQVRICIEVLRAYAGAKNINLPTSFRDQEAQYRGDTYQALLLKLGTSYAALRASGGAKEEVRESLAAALGIPVGDGQQRDYLDELLLDVDSVTESDLERLFGLVDTTRDPLSHGAKLDDARDQVSRWNFENVSWNVNTDIDGCVFVSFSKAGDKIGVEAHRAPNGTAADLEASAEATSGDSKFVLNPYSDNGRTDGLAGELQIEYAAAASDVKFQVVPQFVSWRLQAQRQQWQGQDWVVDAYSSLTPKDQRLPIIDPDLIGPDDFRDPFGTASTPFKGLWQKRRAWVDDLIDHLTGIIFGTGATPQAPADDVFSRLFTDMRHTSYGANNNVGLWAATAEDKLPDRSNALQDKTDKDKLEAATNELWSNYKLTPEMLVRLLGLKKKHADRVYDSATNPALEQDEWNEVINILVQAHKSKWATQWADDENGQTLLLGPEDFWISLSEPKQGDWPPAALAKDISRIDPETLKSGELPDETAGAAATQLWNERQDELHKFEQDLSKLDRNLIGATNRIKAAFPGLAIADLEDAYNNIDTNYVEQTLRWSWQPFKRVMDLRGQLKTGQNPPPPKPTDAEWVEMQSLLTTAYKQYVLWKQWRKAEDHAGLKYWDMVKARLPRWRASVEARQAWQQALRARSAPAIIDPDLLRATHFRPRRISPALDLCHSRATQLDTVANGFQPATRTKAGLETLLEDALGPFASDGLPPNKDGLHTLLSNAIKKNVASERLDQLGISRTALDFLARMYGLLAQTPVQKLTNDEWDEIAAILTQAWKMRQTAAWREEERTSQITLSSDWFKIPVSASTTQFPPPKPPDPPAWRGTRGDVQDWEDRLQSRIDQESTVVDAVHQAVSEVEELTLPPLRDALVSVCGQGADPSAKADWLTERLLIDAKQGGCEKTTRVAQAIETLQHLLWGIRTGLLTDAYPTLMLIPVHLDERAAIEEFDEGWKWIGSYAAWRAAIFVFLYPENILLPSLKRRQTPAFRQLSDDFRNADPISAAKFATFLQRYYAYFNDVCDLTPPQACQSTTSYVYEENELGSEIAAALMPKPVEYLFATTSRGALYWSVVDKSLDADWAQTYWRPLKGFKNDLVSLVGCTVFRTAARRRLLYLFAKTTKDGADVLEFLRLDLERGGWDSDSSQITIDDAKEQRSFDVELEQSTDETTRPTLFLTYPDNRKFRYRLGETGGTDKGVVQALGTTTDWGPVQNTNLGALSSTQRNIERHVGQLEQDYVSATSICVAQFGALKMLLTYWAQHRQQGGASLVQRFCVTSTIAAGAIAWGSVVPIDQNPVETDLWDYVWPVGFATADIRGIGRTDVVWCYLKPAAPANSGYQVWYSVGWALRGDGVPILGWSHEFPTGIVLKDPILGRTDFRNYQQNDLTNVTSNGLKVAIATSPDGANYLVVAAASNPPADVGVSNARADLFVIQLSKTGDVLGSPWTIAGPTSTLDGVPTGVGLAFSDLGSESHLDALVFYLIRPKGDDAKGEYFVGANCDPSNLSPRDGWSSSQPVGTRDAWFGGLTGGAAIALADIDSGIPSSADLIVFHDAYGGGNPGVGGFYRIGKNVGFEALPTAAQCESENSRPVAERIPLSFSGFEPLDLQIGTALQATKTNRNLVYVEEAFYFVPVLVALRLQSAREFIASLDWFRLVYDYTLPAQQRQLVGLAPPKATNDFQRDNPAVQGDEYDWLLDPLNPHAIAQTRKGTYSRFTQLSIIKCLLDYADAEFTTDTSESVPRARELYITALALLYGDELKPVNETCEGVRGDLEIVFGDVWADHTSDLIPSSGDGSIDDLRRLRDGLTKVFKRYSGTDRLLEKAREAVVKIQPSPGPQPRLGEALDTMSAESSQFETAFMTDKVFSDRMEGMAARLFAAEVKTSSGPSRDRNPLRARIGNGGTRAVSARDGVGAPRIKPEPGREISPRAAIPSQSGWLKVSKAFCVPQNPILYMLRLRANLNLYKIRSCRNISGLKRDLEPYAAPTDTQTGLPSIGAGGQLVLPGATSIKPTPYRYQTLIDRAKQLVQLAMQIEQAFLSALEKTDAEAYALLKAKQDLNVAAAGVRLQDLRVTEAQGGVTLASLQRGRAKIQIDTYEKWISAGLNDAEKLMIGGFAVSAAAGIAAAYAESAVQTASAVLPEAVAGPAGVLATARALQAASEAFIRVEEVQASYERRLDEWELGKALAEQDFAIGDQQVDLAEDHVRVTEQEQTIAQMQNDNAKQVVDFLAGKFTNKELYDWMSGVLERVYSFFLQQATAMAQLAQNQLAFERQETPPNYIQPDYWKAQDDGAASGPTSTTDRRGLTGSARLLQDIYQLDQYAFDTNKRKLQLTKTLSLAQLAPFEFQRFRETGLLTFATPMELFDRDFPGHYLRLIKRVRTSVISLIPPNLGIRATLSSTGLSRVVVGGDIYQTINLRRDPETIALSSPINATGLFDLDVQQQTDMLLPMEGTGVDTQWEFRMLKSSNPFDYDSIADVLLTIEYTALNSFDYYQQVIQSPALSRPLSADQAYSFRRDFADAWYDLHNPEQSDHPMVVNFETSREEFPPNLSNLKIQQVLLYVGSTTEDPIEIEDVELHFTEQGGGQVGGFASTNGGVISTRRGNAGAWTAMIGKAPFGHWELRLPTNQTVRDLFGDPPSYPQRPAERVADLLLVITYAGRTPPWPS